MAEHGSNVRTPDPPADYRQLMKGMFWTACVLFILGLLIGPSPIFMAVTMPEDSGWMQAGWAVLFFTVPLGLALAGISLVLTVIIGVRGLVTHRPKAPSLVTTFGAAGVAITGLVLFSAFIAGPPVSEAFLMTLAVLSVALFVVTLVAAFLVSRSPGVDRALPEATVTT